MADKVIPFKKTDQNEIEVERISIHTPDPQIATSKTISQTTLPGAKFIWEVDTHSFRIERRGKKTAWIAQTNAIAWFEK